MSKSLCFIWKWYYDVNSNNGVFTIKDRILCPLAVNLSAKNNKKLSKFLSIGHEKIVFGMNVK